MNKNVIKKYADPFEKFFHILQGGRPRKTKCETYGKWYEVEKQGDLERL